MKQTLTFNLSTIASTESKIKVDYFDTSVEAFDNGEYLQSFYALLDYVNDEFREKYGNAKGTEFNIPHGSIVVNIKIEDDRLLIHAPFLSLPEKNRIPLLRQVAGLNFNAMDLAQVELKKDRLAFEYTCPLALANPYKIYYILQEICNTGDKYDDEFETKFGAQRVYEPKVTPFDDETLNTVYEVVQLSCKECMDAVKDFEVDRKYGFAWNVLDTTILKILYYAHPQGQLLNDLNKAVSEMDREDIPLPEVVNYGKSVIARLQGMTKEQWAEDLYYVETFISDKRRSNLKNIQENFENSYNRATQAFETGDYMTCCLMIVYKFYEMYYYNNVQDDVNAVVVRALEKASAKPWDEAAPILHAAMDNIMEGELEPDDDDDEEGEFDMSQMMQGMQQMMQQGMQQAAQAMQQGGGMMEYVQKVQELQQQLAAGQVSMEDYMLKVQQLAATYMGNGQQQ